MLTNSFIIIGTLNIPVIYLLGLIVVLLVLFILWYEGIRDGFNKEKIFDLFFLSLITWLILVSYVNYNSPYNLFLREYQYIIIYTSYFFITLLFTVIFSKKWKWSVFHTLDLFSIVFFVYTLCLFTLKLANEFSVFGLLALLIYLFIYITVYIGKNKLFSGFVFSLFLLFVSIFGQFFYRQKEHLLFYFILITISLLNLIFRRKKAMFTRNINLDFLGNIKKILKSKEKRLDADKKKLQEEDPYLQEGREVGNAEEMDEAILEDRAKIEHDIKVSNIEDMQEQVDKALDKMERGDYGICESCGNPIDKARLEAYPEATACVDCANKSAQI